MVTAGSNVAVDTILERLVKSGQFDTNDIVRVGHPAKMLSASAGTASAKAADTTPKSSKKNKPLMEDEDNDNNDGQEEAESGVELTAKKLKAIQLKRERKEKRLAKKQTKSGSTPSQANNSNLVSQLNPLEYRQRLLSTTHLQYILHDQFAPVLKGIKQDISQIERQLDKPGTKYAERKDLWRQIRQLNSEKRTRESQSLRQVISQCKIIMGTLVGIGSNDVFFAIKDLQKESPQLLFDTLIIDEVSQTLEPACWIPIMAYSPNKLILAGDNNQLSPTIHVGESDDQQSGLAFKLASKSRDTLTRTLFDRLVEIHHKDTSFVKFLNVQYRMNDLIQQFSNEQFYKGDLQAHESVKGHTIKDLASHSSVDEDSLHPLIWLDTSSLHQELTDDESGSKYNIGEVHLAKKYIDDLTNLGIRQDTIGVIAPYSAQVAKLKEIIWPSSPNIEISTVDGFQGREKEIIIFTLVRSNDDDEIGFLKDFKRLNVSITRAKRQVVVIGDWAMMDKCQCKIINDWANFMMDNAIMRYAD